MASSEVQKYNEAQVLLRKDMLISEYTSYAEYYGSYYGLDTETAIMYFLGFESMDAFKEEMGKYAYEVEKNAMIINEIAKIEKIEVSDEQYATEVAEMAEYYGYETAEEFEEANGKENIVSSILSELVMDFIIENAVITEAQ
jgi:trigger factor